MMFENDELKKTVVQENQNEFEYAGDAYLNEYLEELDQPKQEFPEPELPPDPVGEIEETESYKGPPPHQVKRNQLTARFTVKTFDRVIASLFAFHAKCENVEDFYASEDELQDMAEQWAVYFTDENLNVPPWVTASISTGMVVVKKFKAASYIRKINLEKEAQNKENAQLRTEIERLKKEKEAAGLRKEVEELSGKK